MRRETKFFGEIEIEENQIWSFPKGIPGFEDEKEFALLPLEEDGLFLVLQSLKTKEVAFVVSNPFDIVPNYTIDLDEATVNALDIKNGEDVVVLGVLTVREPFHETTMNLQAPLIFNVQTKKAKQMILNENKYGVRHPAIVSADAKEG